MSYAVNFGTLARPAAPAVPGQRFRLAVLGDFSGRANRGVVETGAALARRTPIPVDVDNLDDVLGRMRLELALPLGDDGETVAVPLTGLDDFHPDQLVENVALFEPLLTLRRNLGSKTGFARAAREVMGWSGAEALRRPKRGKRGAAVDPSARLSDFARLTGRPPEKRAEADVEDLVRRLVGPFVQPAKDPQQDALVAQVDAALSAALRRVLHHPDFQAAEALWRSLDLLVRRVETGARTQIVLYDVSAEEWAADLAGTDALEETGLYGMLAEAPSVDANQGALSAVIGLYGFELSPPHADLLGRMAQVAAAAGAPFIAAVEADALQIPLHEANPLVRDAWTALQALPAARYLGLAAVGFLLRMPYGKRSDPIEAFTFEEFTREAGLSGMVWANPAVAAGLLLAQSWTKTGTKTGTKMTPGLVSVIGDMPYYVYTPPDGDQVALPCTERLWSERQVARASAWNAMPVVSLRGRPEVRLAGTGSVAGSALAGFWASEQPAEPAPEPEAAPEADATGAPAATADTDLDALLSGLDGDAESEAEPAGDADLDALLSSLGAEPEPAADGETETDLDALLASL